MKAHPGLLLGYLAMFPLLSMLAIVLLLPLAPYCSDHAPFQSLDIARPDHYVRVFVKVYSAWMSASGGKLKAKDL